MNNALDIGLLIFALIALYQWIRAGYWRTLYKHERRLHNCTKRSVEFLVENNHALYCELNGLKVETSDDWAEVIE